MVRILAVDDHELLRKGIIQVLTSEFPDGFFGEAANAQEALEAVWSQTWDLVLLDMNLPGRSGLEILKEMKSARPRLPVLVLSMHSEREFATRALKAGAAGYLSKNTLAEALLRAVHRVLAGGKYISQRVAEMLASDLLQDSTRPAHEQLSDREHEVMMRLVGGQSVGDIALTLNLSAKTVSTYRTRVLEKMGMHNNAELIHYCDP